MAVDGLLAARPSSLIALRGVGGVVEATRSRARVEGSRHTAAHYRLQGVSWWCIGWGHKKSFPRPVLTQLMGSGTTTWSEKVSGGAVARRRSLSAPVVARECSLSPPLWSPLRSQPRCPTSDPGWSMNSGCKNCSRRREPSRGSILGNILHVMRRSGGGRMESPTVSQ